MIKAIITFLVLTWVFYLLFMLVPHFKPKAILYALGLATLSTATLTLIVLLF